MSATPAPRPLPQPSRILSSDWDAHLLSIHHSRLSRAHALVNSDPPDAMHYAAKLKAARLSKKRVKAEEEKRRIDRENRILLEKMNHIQNRAPVNGGPSSSSGAAADSTPSPLAASASLPQLHSHSHSHSQPHLSSTHHPPSSGQVGPRSLNILQRQREATRILSSNASLVSRLKRGKGFFAPGEFQRHEEKYLRAKANLDREREQRAAARPILGAYNPQSSSPKRGVRSSSLSMTMNIPSSTSASFSDLHPHDWDARPSTTPADFGGSHSRSLSPSPARSRRASPARRKERPMAERQDANGPVQLIYRDTYPDAYPTLAKTAKKGQGGDNAASSSQHVVELAQLPSTRVDGRPCMVVIEEATAVTKTNEKQTSNEQHKEQGCEQDKPQEEEKEQMQPTDEAPKDDDAAAANEGGDASSTSTMQHSLLFRAVDRSSSRSSGGFSDYLSVPFSVLESLPEFVRDPSLLHEHGSDSGKKDELVHHLVARLRFEGRPTRLAFNPSHAIDTSKQAEDDFDVSGSFDDIDHSQQRQHARLPSVWDKIGEDGRLMEGGQAMEDGMDADPSGSPARRASDMSIHDEGDVVHVSDAAANFLSPSAAGGRKSPDLCRTPYSEMSEEKGETTTAVSRRSRSTAASSSSPGRRHSRGRRASRGKRDRRYGRGFSSPDRVGSSGGDRPKAHYAAPTFSSTAAWVSGARSSGSHSPNSTGSGSGSGGGMLFLPSSTPMRGSTGGNGHSRPATSHTSTPSRYQTPTTSALVRASVSAKSLEMTIHETREERDRAERMQQLHMHNMQRQHQHHPHQQMPALKSHSSSTQSLHTTPSKRGSDTGTRPSTSSLPAVNGSSKREPVARPSTSAGQTPARPATKSKASPSPAPSTPATTSSKTKTNTPAPASSAKKSKSKDPQSTPHPSATPSKNAQSSKSTPSKQQSKAMQKEKEKEKEEAKEFEQKSKEQPNNNTDVEEGAELAPGAEAETQKEKQNDESKETQPTAAAEAEIKDSKPTTPAPAPASATPPNPPAASEAEQNGNHDGRARDPSDATVEEKVKRIEEKEQQQQRQQQDANEQPTTTASSTFITESDEV